MKKLTAILIVFLVSGCTAFSSGAKQSIKVDSLVVPGKVSLDELDAYIEVEAKITNVGTLVETISASAVATEGLSISPPDKTRFTLKPHESRTVLFNATLDKDAAPGDYIIDIEVKTEKGDLISGVAKLRVERKKGLF